MGGGRHGGNIHTTEIGKHSKHYFFFLVQRVGLPVQHLLFYRYVIVKALIFIVLTYLQITIKAHSVLPGH